jgi:hypothetical protein
MTDNLWLYGLVQFGTMAALLVIAARREPGLWPVFTFYGMSKISEHFDQQIYSILPLSGHTVKHLLAGIATLYVYRWILALESAPAAFDTRRRSAALPINSSAIACCYVAQKIVAESVHDVGEARGDRQEC